MAYRKPLPVYVSEDERRLIKEAAAREHLTAATWLRALALKAATVPQAEPKEGER